MINHVQTLLLNRDTSYFAAVENGGFIISSFVPVTALSQALINFGRVLVPVGLPREVELALGENLAALTRIPELLPYHDILDSRVIDTETLTSKYFTQPISLVEESNTSTTGLTYVFNPTTVPLAAGGFRTWSISNVDADTLSIDDGTTTTTVDIVVGGAAISHNIYRNVLSISVDEAPMVGSFDYTLTLRLFPTPNFGALLGKIEKIMLGSDVSAKLFSPITGLEVQMLDLKTIWNSKVEMPIRLGGIILAYCYQLDNLRRKQFNGQP
jgi:hypothetical protein